MSNVSALPVDSTRLLSLAILCATPERRNQLCASLIGQVAIEVQLKRGKSASAARTALALAKLISLAAPALELPENSAVAAELYAFLNPNQGEQAS